MKAYLSANLVFAASFLLGGSVVAQTLDVPQKLNLDEFPGEIVDKVVIPVPAEVFAVLDKLGEPDWSGEIQIPALDRGKKGDRVQLSLQFGALVAEGFIAVQAQSIPEIKEIGELALKQSNFLGLGDAVQPHSMGVVDAAEGANWAKVRSELDRTQTTVRETMAKLRDDDLSNLVSLGGWIRGTNALTTLISENFSPDKAELLHQPALVAHFIGVIDEMAEPTRKNGDVAKIREGLVKLREILGNEDRPLSADDVAAMGKVCYELLELYYFVPSPVGEN